MKKAAAGASPKVAKCLVASVATRTNGVNACTDGVHLRDAEWVFSAVLVGSFWIAQNRGPAPWRHNASHRPAPCAVGTPFWTSPKVPRAHTGSGVALRLLFAPSWWWIGVAAGISVLVPWPPSGCSSWNGYRCSEWWRYSSLRAGVGIVGSMVLFLASPGWRWTSSLWGSRWNVHSHPSQGAHSRAGCRSPF